VRSQKGCSVERKITGGQNFEATYGDTSKVGAACIKSSQSGCDVGLTPSGLLPNMQVWVKIGCPKAGTPSYLVYYSIQTNNCGPLGHVSVTICVCVCPCWCVLGRQGICIISPNDKRPQTTLVYIGNLLVQGTSMIGQCFSKVFKLLWVDGWPNKHIDSNSGLVQNVCSPHVQAAGIRITAVPVIFLKTNL